MTAQGKDETGQIWTPGKELKMLHDCAVPEVSHRFLIMKAPTDD